jgi:molybdenum cofactor synthesis domain-containing protein
VAIVSTGNEVVHPGTSLGAGQLYDINQFTLSAVVRRHGGMPAPLPVTRDTLDDLDRAFDMVSGHDVAVFSGGSSVGDRDLLVDALRARGQVIFHGIAVKPGKPTLFGRVGGTLVFGMPGYPTSCLSNAYMLLLPLVRAIARLPPWKPETRVLPLARAVNSTPDRHQFYTVRILNGGAEPAFKASGDITSMADADGYIEIPVGTDRVPAGTMVTVTLF